METSKKKIEYTNTPKRSVVTSLALFYRQPVSFNQKELLDRITDAYKLLSKPNSDALVKLFKTKLSLLSEVIREENKLRSQRIQITNEILINLRKLTAYEKEQAKLNKEKK